MSFNFLKKYIPLIPTPKRQASFKHEKITIPNLETFLEKISILKENHCLKRKKKNNSPMNRQRVLEVITDYDYTLTKYKESSSDKHYDAIFGSFVKCSHLPKQFKQDLIRNYSIYGPYQTDGSITFFQRAQLINHLYKIQLSLFKKHRITTQMLNNLIRDCNIVFRNHTSQFLKLLTKHQIPLYIISGGISDIIYALTVGVLLNNADIINTEEGSTQKQIQYIMNNISIHSNQLDIYSTKRYQYNQLINQYFQQRKAQQFIKFKNQFIHSYNKYKIMGNLPVRNYQDPQKHYSPQQRLPDCILLGDLVSDIYMSRTYPFSTILTVFYGKQGQIDQRGLAQKKFDVIVENDGSHRMIYEIIKFIKGSQNVDWRYIYECNKQLESLMKWL